MLSPVVGRPIVENCLNGYNSSVLAYGQTGSGKTFTMLGEVPARAEDMPEQVDPLDPVALEVIPKTAVSAPSCKTNLSWVNMMGCTLACRQD